MRVLHCSTEPLRCSGLHVLLLCVVADRGHVLSVRLGCEQKAA